VCLAAAKFAAMIEDDLERLVAPFNGTVRPTGEFGCVACAIGDGMVR